MHFVHTIVSEREMVNNGKNLKQGSKNMKGTNNQIIIESEKNYNVSWKCP